MNIPLSTYDLVMLVVLAGAAILGALKGMVWQIASLASIIVSAYVAARFNAEVAPRLSQQAPWNHYLAMLLLYVATSLVIWLVFRVVANFVDQMKIKSFDRQLGALFGILKGAAICLVITFFAVTLSETTRQPVLHSLSGQYIAVFLKKVEPILPAEAHKALGGYIDQFEQRLNPNSQLANPLLPQLERNLPTLPSGAQQAPLWSSPMSPSAAPPSQPATSSPAIGPIRDFLRKTLAPNNAASATSGESASGAAPPAPGSIDGNASADSANGYGAANVRW